MGKQKKTKPKKEDSVFGGEVTKKMKKEKVKKKIERSKKKKLLCKLCKKEPPEINHLKEDGKIIKIKAISRCIICGKRICGSCTIQKMAQYEDAKKKKALCCNECEIRCKKCYKINSPVNTIRCTICKGPYCKDKESCTECLVFYKNNTRKCHWCDK